VTEPCLHKKHPGVPFIPHLQKRVTGLAIDRKSGAGRKLNNYLALVERGELVKRGPAYCAYKLASRIGLSIICSRPGRFPQ
jgi:hypothetical protein